MSESKKSAGPPRPARRPVSELQKEITDNARVIPLDQLQKRGTRFVRVIDPATLGRILAKSVTKALQRREVHLAGTERQEIERAARAEFAQLMGEHQKVLKEKTDAERRREALEQQVDDLRGEVQLAQQRLGKERQRLAGEQHGRLSPEALQDVELRVKGLLRRMLDDGDLTPSEDGAPPDQLQAFHDALTITVSRVVDEQRRRVAEEQRGAREEEIELLERRIAKLSRALTEKEQALGGTEGAKPFARSASAYEPSKGISSEDPRYKTKKGMLKAMFEENLEAQGGPDGGARRPNAEAAGDAGGDGGGA